MALSRIQIEMNYKKAIDQAKELERIAQNLTTQANGTYGNALSALAGNWKGTSADTYQTKANKVKNDVLKTAKELGEAAATIRSIAKRIRDADLKALEVAQRSSRK